MKKILRSFIISVLTIGLTLLAGKISETKVFRIVFPETIALEEFDFTDFITSKRNTGKDDNVIVINIGYLTRGEIGDQIALLSKYKPKAIGIDIIFSCVGDSLECPQNYDSIGNAKIVNAIKGFKNTVLSTRLWVTPKNNSYDSIEHTILHHLTPEIEGFTNLENEASNFELLKKIRRFNPVETVKGQDEFAFSVQLAYLADSIKTSKFLQSKQTLINFRGNKEYFTTFDWNITDTTDLTVVKDKVVIMGFIGRDLKDISWDSKFFTPLNKKVIGLTMPDMTGVYVHANIVSMILNEDIINESSAFTEFLIMFIICFTHIFILLNVHEKYPTWFDSASILLIVFQLVVFSFLRISMFEWFQFKINLTTTLGTLTLASIAVNLYQGPFSKYLMKKDTGSSTNKG